MNTTGVKNLNTLRDEGNPLNYIFRREVFNKRPSDKSIVDDQLESKKDLFYRKNLYAHYGCINAIEFSKDGSLLASGGDDRRILLWNVHKTLVGKQKPKIMQAEHSSNVFALAFDCSKSKLFSAGNDNQVIVHDIESGTPLDFFRQEMPIFGVCADPINSSIFCTAGDDGRLRIYDIRSDENDFCLVKLHSSFHSVMFHPIEPRMILSANAKEGAALWDIRMPKKVLLKYGRQTGEQCTMSAQFNQNGTQVFALRRRFPPILYSTHASGHLFQFNHSSYYNSCTMKSSSFAGTDDRFVMSGSDNFDLHVWRIPPEGSNQWVNEADIILKGHRSIVNQVRYNRNYDLIASSGVEKLIKLWSPFAIPDEDSWKFGETGLRSESERKIFAHEEYIRLTLRSGHGQFMAVQQDIGRRSTSEDSRMMAFFDALVQRDIAGLSENDSGEDSNYTNTIYSTEDTSSSDNEVSTVIANPTNLQRASNSMSIPTTSLRQSQSLTRNTTLNSSSQEFISLLQEDNNNQTVDLDDLPLINSSGDSSLEDETEDGNDRVISPTIDFNQAPFQRLLIVERETRGSSTRNVLESEDETVVPKPPTSQGKFESNRLTNLIAENKKKLARRDRDRCVESPNKKSRKRKRSVITSSMITRRIKTNPPIIDPSSSEEEEQETETRNPLTEDNTESISSRNANHSRTHNRRTYQHFTVRERTRSFQSTPIYDSSNNTTPSSSSAVGASYAFILERMTRPSQQQYEENSSLQNDMDLLSSNNDSSSSSLSSSSSSSSTSISTSTSSSDKVFIICSNSSSNSDDSSGSERESKEQTSSKIKSKKLRPRQKKYLSKSKISLIRPSSDSEIVSTSSDFDKEPPKKKKRWRSADGLKLCLKHTKKFKTKVKSKVGTPSDSGIDMKNSNDAQKPCCSKTLFKDSKSKEDKPRTESPFKDSSKEIEKLEGENKGEGKK